jgi:hypothetical protein
MEWRECGQVELGDLHRILKSHSPISSTSTQSSATMVPAQSTRSSSMDGIVASACRVRCHIQQETMARR